MTLTLHGMNLSSIIHDLDSALLNTNKSAMYAKSDDGLVILFIEDDSFDFLGAHEPEDGAQKFFDARDFLHQEDIELLVYSSLIQEKLEQLTFPVRVVKEDSFDIMSAEIKKLYFCSTNKIIVFRMRLSGTHSQFSIDEQSKVFNDNFRSLLKNSKDFLYFKDMHHNFTAVSSTMADITGFSSDTELIGLNDYSVFPKEHADIYYSHEKEILLGEKDSIENIEPYFDENGDEGWVDTRKFPVKNENGIIIGLFGISRIITNELLIKRELEKAKKELEVLANLDGLTSLLNRRYGYERCTQVIKEASRYKCSLSLIMFDIDYFKVINDTYGHEIGDKVLVFLSDIIRNVIRDTDIAFRYGGEEFVICTPHTTLHDAFVLMERVNKLLSLELPPAMDSHITVSSGVAQWKDKESVGELIKRADGLLYKAKEAGRNCIKY